MSAPVSNVRPKPDRVLVDIADYVAKHEIKSAEAFNTARAVPDGHARLRPRGARIPGLHQAARPARSRHRRSPRARGSRARASSSTRSRRRSTSARRSAGSISTTPGSPPSGAIPRTTSAASSPSRTGCRATARRSSMRDVLTAMIKAHEIQGVIALENSFNRVGLDHVVLVKVATTAVVAQMLGLSREAVINAVSHAWVDGQSAAHLPPRAQHRLAQVLGGGRRDLARRAPRAHREDRRDGLSVGALAPRAGASTTCCSAASRSSSSGATAPT